MSAISRTSEVVRGHEPPSALSRRVLITVFVVFVAAIIARFLFLVLHPPIDSGLFEYDAIAGIRESWWFSHFFLAGLGFPATFGALGILVVGSCANRGSGPALVGALVATAGALLTGLGFAAEGVTWAYLTDPAVTDPAVGAKVLASLGEHPAMIDGPILTGFLFITVGVFTQLIALWRSARVPHTVLVAVTVVLVVAAVPLALPHWAEGVKAGIELVALLSLGAFLVRRR